MPRNPKGVRVTVYLPDSLRELARAAGINLSATLRDGVERQLRGDSQPTVEIEQTEHAIEIRIGVPLDLIRPDGQARPT